MRQKPAKRKRPVGRPSNPKVAKLKATGMSRATAYRRLAAAKADKDELREFTRVTESRHHGRDYTDDGAVTGLAAITLRSVTITQEQVGRTYRIAVPRPPTDADVAKMKLLDIVRLTRLLKAETARRYARRNRPAHWPWPAHLPKPPSPPTIRGKSMGNPPAGGATNGTS